MPPFSEIVKARMNDTELFVEFMTHIVWACRGKTLVREYAKLARMSSFDSVKLTASTESFALFTIADKEAVWKEHIAAGKRLKNPVAKPTYTSQGRCTSVGMPLEYDGGDENLDSGILVSNGLLRQVEDERKDVTRNATLLEAVKKHYQQLVDADGEMRRMKALAAAQRKRKRPPAIAHGKVDADMERQMDEMFPMDEVTETAHV